MIIPEPKKVLRDGINKYHLVIIAAKRARQLMDGAKPRVETKSIKPVTIALEEISSGELRWQQQE